MVPVQSNGADIPPAVCIWEMSLFPAGQGRAGVTVPVRAGLLLQTVPKVTSSHGVLECCLGGVFQDGCFPSCSCSGILRGCDLRGSTGRATFPSPGVQLYWGRAKNQELRTFISEIHVDCSHAGMLPVPAVLGWVSCRSVWCACFGGLVVRTLLGTTGILGAFPSPDLQDLVWIL